MWSQLECDAIVCGTPPPPVCGFEAFINGKHIIGEVKEKEQAHREYREAISKGHGAYLMDEETPVSITSVDWASKCLCIQYYTTHTHTHTHAHTHIHTHTHTHTYTHTHTHTHTHAHTHTHTYIHTHTHRMSSQ